MTDPAELQRVIERIDREFSMTPAGAGGIRSVASITPREWAVVREAAVERMAAERETP